MAALHKKMKHHAKRLKHSIKRRPWLKAAIFIGAFMVVGGSIFLLVSHAATPSASLEAENASTVGNASTGNDLTASAGKYLQFKKPIVNSGTMPTRANTGPRYAMTDMTPTDFYNTRSCNRQRITGPIDINQASMKGQTFNLTDCEVMGAFEVHLACCGTQIPLSDAPILNFSYVDVDGGMSYGGATKLTMDHSYVDHKFQLSLTDRAQYGTGPSPANVTNSMFYSYYVSGPYNNKPHSEVYQTLDYVQGQTFTNVVFMQQGGPLEFTDANGVVNGSGVTAVINVRGDGMVFDGCYFLWDGPQPTYYLLYLSGPNIVVKNSKLMSGGIYTYNIPANMLPTFINNTDYTSGNPITLP